MRKSAILLFVLLPLAFCMAQSESKQQATGNPKITFIELGSDRCVPCKQMQPILKSVQKKYAEQISVVFYDVWQADQKQYADKYKVRLIPTQVFLDEKGKELYRHEGFLPEKEIDKFLKSKGLKPKEAH